MNVLLNSTGDFGFIWNETESINNVKYGDIKVVIGCELYPDNNKKFNFTLQTVFSNLKSSFSDKYFPDGDTGKEFGEREFNIDLWEDSRLTDIFVIETTEMGGYEHNQLSLYMGYSGKFERLFYSFDNEASFREIRYPKGTVERIINQLPTY